MLSSVSDAFALVQREAAIMLVFYALAFAMILADLLAGVRKAKRAGRYVSSSGLRRTVDKVCRYFNMMLIFSIVDVVLIVSVGHYNAVAGAALPAFPAFTLAATLMVAIMEGRSIYESLDRKTRAAAEDAAGAVAYLVRHIDEVDKIVSLAERVAERRKHGDNSVQEGAECDG